MKKQLAAAALVLALAGCAAPAAPAPNTDAADTQVIATMRALPGADNFDDQEFVTQAHRVCDVGRDTPTLLTYGFSLKQAQTLLGLAHTYYCPGGGK